MSDESKTEIDPRFDPAFQRGFEPAPGADESPRPPVSRPAAPAPTPLPATKVVPVQAPPPRPVAKREATPVAAPELVQDEVVRLVDDRMADDAAAEDAADDSNPTRNPFLLALGIIAVVLIAVGVWLFAQTGQAFNSRQVRSQGDYMTLVATIQMAPFIALLGGATAIGVIFMFAVKWRRRRAGRTD